MNIRTNISPPRPRGGDPFGVKTRALVPKRTPCSNKGIYSAFSYLGGKHFQMPDILPHISELGKVNNSSILIECFGGGGRLVLNQDKLDYKFDAAVYNEVNPYVYSLMTVLKDATLTKALQTELLSMDITEYKDIFEMVHIRQTVDKLIENNNDIITKAMYAYVRIIFSRGGTQQVEAFNNKDINDITQYYIRHVKHLSTAFEHLKNVMTMNVDYSKIMKAFGNNKAVVKYLDPPYHPVTRFGGKKNMNKIISSNRGQYDFDFTREDHLNLVKILNESHNWVLSGYDPLEYDCDDYVSLEEHGAEKINIGEFDPPVNLGKGHSQKNEFIWVKE